MQSQDPSQELYSKIKDIVSSIEGLEVINPIHASSSNSTPVGAYCEVTAPIVEKIERLNILATKLANDNLPCWVDKGDEGNKVFNIMFNDTIG